MKRLVECVPNFSEGRDARTVDALVDSMNGVRGAWVLDRTSDFDHNRSVITLAGEPEAVAEAAIRAVGTAAALIDLNRQAGVHPRIGATDVLPFIPLEGVSIAECVALARRVGQEIWERYRIPVYFYEEAATRPERVNLEDVRKGQFEGLTADALRNPDRSPDIGEPRLHPTAGATAVGVRKLLIAYNIHLNSSDVSAAKEIAKAIRFSSGGFRYVKAIGVELKTRGVAQVSINLTDFEQTPLHRVFETVKREAERHGCSITGSEIIGLIPRKAIELLAEYYLKLENFSPARVLENRLTEAMGAPFSIGGAHQDQCSPIQPALEALREAAENLATGIQTEPSANRVLETDPIAQAEAQLEMARSALQVFERLVQLEPVATQSILSDLSVARQMAMGAVRGRLQNASISLEAVSELETVSRLKSRMADIEARLLAAPLAAR